MSAGNGMREHDGVEAALAAALCPRGVDDASARAAVAAFRTARDSGLHRSRRTRRREDWRPVRDRRGGRPLKTALAALAASLTLGGVAFAAAASHDTAEEQEPRDPEPGSSTSVPLPPRGPGLPPFTLPNGASTPPPGAPGTRIPHDRTAPPHPNEALCLAYEKSRDQGKALEAAAWQRLVAAADDHDVATYCATLLTPTPAPPNDHPAPTGEKTPSGTPADPASTHPAHRPPTPSGAVRLPEGAPVTGE
ncbi:hypothetical protein [Streptomyces sp. NPDC002825]|uniref:hypothetical protein n=1 Tax=Streptomyces sp. NPDC002825 TaxID=3154666 RepID=UPI00332DA5CB